MSEQPLPPESQDALMAARAAGFGTPPPKGWTPGENVVRELLKAVVRNALRPENLMRSLDDFAARLAAVDRRRAAEWLSPALLGLLLPLFDAPQGDLP